MRVSKAKSAENRNAILNAASRLFRRYGIDGVGVAEIAREAGLTHGALYAHFESKDALAAEAFSHGFQRGMANVRARAGKQASFQEHLNALLSPRSRDNLETGCPLAASASEIGRQCEAVSSSFTSAFEEMVTMFESSLGREIPAARRRRLAISAVVAQVGAIAVSRAVAKTHSALAAEILKSVRETVGQAGTKGAA